LQTGEIIFIPDALTDPRMAPVVTNLKQLDIRSILIIPMVYQEEILGTLFLRTSRDRRPFTKAEMLFCQVAARIGANALLGLSAIN
jgi:GAF domain-containing protein